MKRNKILTLLLASNLFILNTIANTSLANNKIDNRYETIEGERIIINNSKDGELHEIEIFGNTVQDSDDLEDVQSVGELYTDKDGSPILDKNNNKQYLVNIISTNMEFDYSYYLNDSGVIDRGIYELKHPIYVSKGEKFTLVTQGINNTDDYSQIMFGNSLFDSDGIMLNTGVWYKSFYNNELKIIRLTALQTGYITHMKFINCGRPDQYDITTFKLVRGEYNNVSDIKEYKIAKDIILPCQLQKIGNFADKLYWDSEKGKYIVEKYIDKFMLDDNLHWIHQTLGKAYCARFSLDNKYQYFGNNADYNIVSGFNVYGARWELMDNTQGFYNYSGTKYLSIVKEPAISTLDEFKLELKNNEYYVLSILKTPEIISTNITKQLKLPTYEGKTYIYTETKNKINPTLKITIDRIEQVSQEAVDNAISSPTSNNIALARMFVNMLPESLYKDQLQAQLNEIFSSDIVLEKQSATANLDVYIQSENILMMSLDTNTVTFEDYSGVEELELQNAINISINSSLPYQLNAYIVGNITNKDKNKTLDLDVLNIKDNSELEYKKFDNINNKLVLLDNISKGNDISHSIDLKLSGDKAHDADVYKTTIKLEAEQK